MQKAYRLIFLLVMLFSPAFGGYEIEKPPFIQASQELSNQPRLVINNRPLAKINGKVISLCDVVKKMDLFLFEYYPNLAPSAVEKYQFYMSRWEPTLDEMICDELVLLDAHKKEIKISDGAVREEIEQRFGPNVMSNLNKVSYDYEEAREMVRQELTVQQLIGMKVHSKAFQTTTPEAIKKAYEKYLEKNPPEEEWKYQVLSIRGKDKLQCERVAEKAYSLLEKEGELVENLPSMIEEESVSVSLSDDYCGTSQKLSKMHFDVIKALSPHSYSSPVLQVSRYDNSSVVRIFYLKDVIKMLPEAFEQMQDRLKNELLYESSEKEKVAYIETLKKRFGYQSHNPKFELPEDYKPFAVL